MAAWAIAPIPSVTGSGEDGFFTSKGIDMMGHIRRAAEVTVKAGNPCRLVHPSHVALRPRRIVADDAGILGLVRAGRHARHPGLRVFQERLRYFPGRSATSNAAGARAMAERSRPLYRAATQATAARQGRITGAENELNEGSPHAAFDASF